MNQVGKHQRPQILRRSRVSSDSTFCNYSHRVCMQPRLEGFEYCNRHILEDKGSPFKQCQYTSSKTNKRCTSAAAKSDRKEGYCPDHARRAAHIRLFISRKRCPKETPETLLEDLDHYVSRRPNSGSSDGKKSRSAESSASKHNKIIDYASSSDSDVEGLAVDNTWRGDGDSDAESVDSEQEDPLKHAGVYTAEEVALITRDKLIRLQSLYIDQFKRLQHVMKEKRRRYLHTVHKEREALGSIHYAKHDPEQRGKYESLVAMKRYHRRYGQEALLHRQSKERRIAVSEGSNYRPPSYPKCVFCKPVGKCGARTVPLSKYCYEHILHDPHQVLHQPCNFAGACKRPIAALFDNSACLYHSELEDIEPRLPNKREEKDESKDEIDVVGEADIKQEHPHQSLQLQLHLQQQQLDNKEDIPMETVTDSKETTTQKDLTGRPPASSTNDGGQQVLASTEKDSQQKPDALVLQSAQPPKSKETTSSSPQVTSKSSRTSTEVSKEQTKPASKVAEGKRPQDIPRPIAPVPTTPSQLSPTKPAQVPLVVSDLLKEEAATKLQIDPLRRPLVSTQIPAGTSQDATPGRKRTISNSSAGSSHSKTLSSGVTSGATEGTNAQGTHESLPTTIDQMQDSDAAMVPLTRPGTSGQGGQPGISDSQGQSGTGDQGSNSSKPQETRGENGGRKEEKMDTS